MAVLKLKNKKELKDQFVLTVGDEGAILVFFKDGKMENRIFVDSPLSADTKLLEKLFSTYPKVPILMLVDVIEQNYSQQFLPPVSSFGIRQQIQRKIRRDFQPNDLNNVLPLGRSTQGRKDWSFLFISLANTDPFARWLEFILNQKNRFDGVFLLPIESIKMIKALSKASGEIEYEWEVLVLHNKTGGFRIVVLKEGKLIFTRLAQNMVGDNIPDIIVGNLEQEVANTVEYLKRLAFKGEQGSKITIVASAEILQKVESKSLKFGKVELLTPHLAAEKLGLVGAVNDKDKFSDILSAAQFASEKKHTLKFSSPYTARIEKLYLGIKLAYSLAGLIAVLTLFYTIGELSEVVSLRRQRADIESELFNQQRRLQEVQAKEARLPSDYKVMQEILEISRMLPQDKYSELRVLQHFNKVFGTMADGRTQYLVNRIDYNRSEVNTTGAPTQASAVGQPGAKEKFDMTIDIDFMILEAEQDRLENYLKKFEDDIKTAFPPEYTIEFVQYPRTEAGNKFEEVNTSSLENKQTNILVLPAKIKISGDVI